MPASPAPLTVSLAALLAREDLALRQAAGPPAAGTRIAWVHTSELDDPVPYVLGGELLLTAGVGFRAPSGGGLPGGGPSEDGLSGAGSSGDAGFGRYVARLVEAGAVALGFGVAPVHDAVPPGLVAACDRHGLPLVEVPPQTPFAAVARAVWLALSEARHQELRRMTEAQQALAVAAAGPDPVPAVLRRLAHALQAWVVLLDGRGREVHAAGARPAPPGPERLAGLAAVLHGEAAPDTATDHVAGLRLSAHALPGTGLVLGLAARRQDPVDRSVAGVGAVLLSLLTGVRRGLPAAGAAAALVRLLLGAGPEEAAPLLREGRWRVVRGRRSGVGRLAGAGGMAGSGGPSGAGGSGGPGGWAGSGTAGEAAPDLALGTPFVDVTGDGTGAANGNELRALLPEDADVAELPGWTLGVSAPAEPSGLALAEGEAERALRRALATRRPLVRHTADGSGVSALVSPDAATALARARLAPLAGAPPLLETLRTWLSLHGSWDRTAVALGVHRNTVRQRIARIESLLGADLSDADTRMEVWFALRWLPDEGGAP
jgi:PucR C-terminal helix-turn-helix domain/Purine catabolism regulatory protein-like family